MAPCRSLRSIAVSDRCSLEVAGNALQLGRCCQNRSQLSLTSGGGSTTRETLSGSGLSQRSSRDIPVIAILIDHSRMPSESELPASLALLADYNAIDMDHGREVHHRVDLLIRIAATGRTDAFGPGGGAVLRGRPHWHGQCHPERRRTPRAAALAAASATSATPRSGASHTRDRPAFSQAFSRDSCATVPRVVQLAEGDEILGQHVANRDQPRSERGPVVGARRGAGLKNFPFSCN